MKQKYIEDDLVMTRTKPNNFIPNGVVCKFVDYMAIDKVLIRTINGIDRFIVGKDQIVPIHLTPSILEKNGWKRFAKKYNSSRFWFNDNIGDSAEFEEFNGHFSPKIFKLPIIYYVHHLQHYFFGLGIKIEIEV